MELQGHPEQLNGGDHDWLIETLVSAVSEKVTLHSDSTCLLGAFVFGS